MTDRVTPPICPYCGAVAKCVSDKAIYHRSYGKMVWVCANYPQCDSYVGCHPGGNKPLGRMADAELRQWKKKAHAAFDPMWRRLGWKRQRAYEWLANQLHVRREDCHIGMFDVAKCKEVIDVCDRYVLEVYAG